MVELNANAFFYFCVLYEEAVEWGECMWQNTEPVKRQKVMRVR